MRTAPSWAAIREADRLDRSLGERRAARADARGERRGDGAAFVTALGFGVPLVPFAAMALGADVSSRWWPGVFGFLFAVTAHFHAEFAVRRTPFEALRFPDSGALLVARFLRRSRWLLWSGACLGAFRALQMAEQGVGSRAAIAVTAAVLAMAPLCYTAICAACAAAEAPSRPFTAGLRSWIATGLAAVVAAAATIVGVTGLFGNAFLGAVFLHPRGAGVPQFTAPGRRATAAAAVAWLVGVCYVAGGRLRADSVTAQDAALVTLVLLFVFSVVATPFLVRWAARQRPAVAQSAEGGTASSGLERSGARAEDERDRRLRRPHAGVGLAAAVRRDVAIRVRRGLPQPAWSVRHRMLWWVLAPALGFVWHGRAVLGAAALVAWGDDVALPGLAFAIAATAPAAAPAGLPPRLFLLGADARDLVRTHLRSIAATGALPALAAAAVAAAFRGFDPFAGVAVATLAACFLLRAGWRGFAGETSDAAGKLSTAGAVVALLVLQAHLPSGTALLPWAALVAAVGAAGIACRLAAKESSLRNEMRRALLESDDEPHELGSAGAS